MVRSRQLLSWWDSATVVVRLDCPSCGLGILLHIMTTDRYWWPAMVVGCPKHGFNPDVVDELLTSNVAMSGLIKKAGG